MHLNVVFLRPQILNWSLLKLYYRCQGYHTVSHAVASFREWCYEFASISAWLQHCKTPYQRAQNLENTTIRQEEALGVI